MRSEGKQRRRNSQAPTSTRGLLTPEVENGKHPSRCGSAPSGSRRRCFPRSHKQTGPAMMCETAAPPPAPALLCLFRETIRPLAARKLWQLLGRRWRDRGRRMKADGKAPERQRRDDPQLLARRCPRVPRPPVPPLSPPEGISAATFRSRPGGLSTAPGLGSPESAGRCFPCGRRDRGWGGGCKARDQVTPIPVSALHFTPLVDTQGPFRLGGGGEWSL